MIAFIDTEVGIESKRVQDYGAVREDGAVLHTHSAQEDIGVLDAYLGSEAWHADRADDEAGRLPHNLPRGVLSEDAIWNLLERNRELKERMKHL